MRSNIHWVGFSQDLPWILGVIVGWSLVTVASVGIGLTLRPNSEWVLKYLIVAPQLVFGGLVFWMTRQTRRVRTRALKLVAEQMGMTFLPVLDDDELLPRHDLPLMVHRYGRMRNLLSGDFGGVKVSMFDLAAGPPKGVREQTVAYFPDPLPGLSDFPKVLRGSQIPAAYAAVVRGFGGLSVETRHCHLIVYRWHHLVRPDSYPEFLALARQVYDVLAKLAESQANSS